MLEHLSIRNFQSIRSADMVLGKFTVIVGESSHGKSAIVRAIDAVANNQLDSDFITQGQKYSSVSLKTEEGTVTIERKTGGTSAYKVAQAGSKESSFTKLNRQVPTEVTEVLGLIPSTKEVKSINFAGQHDSPYLLKDSSSNVARVLGELTNVSTIFEAVSRATKKVKSANTLVNLRKKDLDKVLTQISDYVKITEEAALVSELEVMLAEAQSLEVQANLLESLVNDLVQHSFDIVIPDIPDIVPIVQAQTDFNEFVALIRQVAQASKDADIQESSITAADSDILHAEGTLHQTLVEAGSCPLCNQRIMRNEI